MHDRSPDQLIHVQSAAGEWQDKTSQIARIVRGENVYRIRFVTKDGSPGKEYVYGAARVRILRSRPERRVPRAAPATKAGATPRRPDATGPATTAPASHAVGRTPPVSPPDVDARATEIMRYWSRIVEALPDGDDNGADPLQRPFAGLRTRQADSALDVFLHRSPLARDDARSLITPFPSSLSQREAVEQALRHRISVVEGPPGTGKTQTILNLIATLIAVPGTTVGVVSTNNAAVDNVREKLDGLGYGFVVAALGRRELRDAFFAEQAIRDAAVRAFLLQPPPSDVDARTHAARDARIRTLLAHQRDLHVARLERDALELERDHFTRHLAAHDVDPFSEHPTHRGGADRILDYLIEATDAESSDPGLIEGWIRRFRWRWRYGELRRHDVHDSATILRLHDAYYSRRITELTAEIARLDALTSGGGLDELVENHMDASRAMFTQALRARYSGTARTRFDAANYRKRIPALLDAYPVVLSTCHSIRASLGGGALLDYVIIDESSQVNLPTAALALASARNAVIVGDRRQLRPIFPKIDAAAIPAPSADVDALQHSVLTAVTERFGDDVPVTLLREHFRCDPRIIGFCNTSFYDGQLIPFTIGDPDRPAMHVRTTTAGHHMRSPRSGGRINDREASIIASELFPELATEFAPGDVGIVTPYRAQVDVAAGAIAGTELAAAQADTVHSYQGREKQTIVMSAVLDDSWRAGAQAKFADDPQLINVAVSRAVRRFILVTHETPPRSAVNLTNLVGFINYQYPDGGVQQTRLVSIFDLLYERHSARLDHLAGRLRGEMKFRSEDIAWTVVLDILNEPAYGTLHVTSQVLLRELIPSLDGLSDRERSFVKHRSSVDMVLFNRITHRPVLAIEVDGWKFHADDPEQLKRDEIKDGLLRRVGLPLLRLRTTGDSEPARIRDGIDAALLTVTP